MLERGIVVSYETIRRWCGKFGQTYAGALRRRQPQSGDKVASGRGLHQDQRAVAVPVAGRRPGRERPRHPRAEPMRADNAGACLPSLGDLSRRRPAVIFADTVRSCRAWWKSLGTYVS
jgi:hypothetical protein